MDTKRIGIIGVAAGLIAVGIWLGGPKPKTIDAQAAVTPRAATRPPASDTPALLGSGTHADASPHSPNVKSFADYHVEAQVTKSGTVELFLYGGKPGELCPIDYILGDVMDAKVFVTGEDSAPVTLSAKPFPTDGDGQASRFVGTFHPAKVHGGQIALSLSLPFEGRTYRVRWSPSDLAMADGGGGSHGNSDAAMPAAVTDTEG